MFRLLNERERGQRLSGGQHLRKTTSKLRVGVSGLILFTSWRQRVLHSPAMLSPGERSIETCLEHLKGDESTDIWRTEVWGDIALLRAGSASVCESQWCCRVGRSESATFARICRAGLKVRMLTTELWQDSWSSSPFRRSGALKSRETRHN